MSLIDFIEKIQNKPRHIRLQILWLSVFISMLIITSLWVVSLKISLSIDDKSNISENKQDIDNDMVSLKDAFKASISAFFEKEDEEDAKQTEFQSGVEVEGLDKLDEMKPAKLPLSK